MAHIAADNTVRRGQTDAIEATGPQPAAQSPAAALPPEIHRATISLEEVAEATWLTDGSFDVARGPSAYSRSLITGLAILRCFSAEQPRQGITDLADRLGLGRSTTHRYLKTLLALGYLEQDSSRKYLLGGKVADLGQSVLGVSPVGVHFLPHLEDLRAASGYSVSMGILSGPEVIYLWHLPSRRKGQALAGPNVNRGVRVPAYCTSMGKALVAQLADDAQTDLLTESELTRRTDKTTVLPSLLRAQFAEAHANGYAVSDQEFYLGARSLAVPVIDGGRPLAAVAVSVYASALSINHLVRRFLPLLLDTVSGAFPLPTVGVSTRATFATGDYGVQDV